MVVPSLPLGTKIIYAPLSSISTYTLHHGRLCLKNKRKMPRFINLLVPCAHHMPETNCRKRSLPRLGSSSCHLAAGKTHISHCQEFNILTSLSTRWSSSLIPSQTTTAVSSNHSTALASPFLSALFHFQCPC